VVAVVAGWVDQGTDPADLGRDLGWEAAVARAGREPVAEQVRAAVVQVCGIRAGPAAVALAPGAVQAVGSAVEAARVLEVGRAVEVALAAEAGPEQVPVGAADRAVAAEPGQEPGELADSAAEVEQELVAGLVEAALEAVAEGREAA